LIRLYPIQEIWQQKECTVKIGVVRYLTIVSILSIGTVTLSAQNLGSIVGLVTDKTGAVIPGAEVKITYLSTSFTRTFTTNETGNYVAPAL